VYWPQEAIRLHDTGNVEEISLDHDQGDDDRATGYDVILWIEEAVALRGHRPPKISCTQQIHQREKRRKKACSQSNGLSQSRLAAGPDR
jgi:hypothetical protein